MSTEYAVHPLLLGEAEVGNVLDVFWSLTTKTGKVTVPILAFLIEGGPDPILVDTGMRSPERAMEVHRLGRHSQAADQTLEAALAKHDVALADVRTCLLTHLHYDHAGACEQLPNATFVVQRSELAAAATPIGPKTLEIGSGELFYDRLDVAAMVSDLWDRVELLEGDAVPFGGIECVLYPDTHTPGSQVVYVQTAEGTLALVGDIIRKLDVNVEQGIPPGLYYDLEDTRRAIADIRRRADVIWPTHTPDVAELAR
jgi:N-acyl homoserine lactone hydrolase